MIRTWNVFGSPFCNGDQGTEQRSGLIAPSIAIGKLDPYFQFASSNRAHQRSTQPFSVYRGSISKVRPRKTTYDQQGSALVDHKLSTNALTKQETEIMGVLRISKYNEPDISGVHEDSLHT